MDKYTKTINELKKEYRNLKLSNTHNKFSNNKLINGGGDLVNNVTEAAFSTVVGTAKSAYNLTTGAAPLRNQFASTSVDPVHPFTDYGSESRPQSTDTTLKPINTDPSTIVQNPENKNKILKGSVSMLDFLLNSTKVNLDEISDYTQNFYLDNNLVPLHEGNSFLVMNSMVFTYSDFI